MPKGDKLVASTNKVRDRCYLNPGVVVDGFDQPQPIKGTILQTQSFNNRTQYLVIIDGEKPPGFWYDASGVTIKQGKLQPLQPGKQAQVIITNPDKSYSAKFLLDQNGVDSYISEGFTVILDDTKNPS